MKVILCLDDNNGMIFNQRRQSRDSVVIQDILEIVSGKMLWMNAYSVNLFHGDNICVDEEFLSKCPSGEYCFVENKLLQEHEAQIEEVIVYRWGRVYPADMQLDIPLESDRYTLISEKAIVGYSHPEIIRKVYQKKGV